MRLSILICTIPERLSMLQGLLFELNKQKKNKPVEIIYLGDFKNMTVGEKRNLLMYCATGDYVCYVDDDDHISENYIDLILDKIDENPQVECISIGGHHTKNKDQNTRSEFSFQKEHGKNYNYRETDRNSPLYGKMINARLPNHLCVWRRDIAERVKFPEKSLGEDHIWGEKQMELGYDYVELNEDMYYYDFDVNVTQTRR